jgi:hypothetical protein
MIPGYPSVPEVQDIANFTISHFQQSDSFQVRHPHCYRYLDNIQYFSLVQPLLHKIYLKDN